MAPMTVIALLRGINLAGRNRIAMADLRAMLQDLGFDDPRTLLQSGNAIFRTSKPVDATLERTLEAACATQFDMRVDFFVRSAADLTAIIDNNPMPEPARKDPSHYVVVFMKEAPSASAIRELQAAIPGRETVRVHGRHAYVVYPDGIGPSKLTSAIFDRTLRTSGTARNWNTVLKLAALAADT